MELTALFVMRAPKRGNFVSVWHNFGAHRGVNDTFKTQETDRVDGQRSELLL